MEGDDPVLYDTRFVMPSGAIVVVFARRSDEVSRVGGVKYRLHYGFPGDEHPILRYDNGHDYHERHAGETVTEFDFPGAEALYERFMTEVKRYEREFNDD